MFRVGYICMDILCWGSMALHLNQDILYTAYGYMYVIRLYYDYANIYNI
jgi:hypothetical protein